MWMSALKGEAFSTSSVTPAASAAALARRDEVGETFGGPLPASTIRVRRSEHIRNVRPAPRRYRRPRKQVFGSPRRCRAQGRGTMANEWLTVATRGPPPASCPPRRVQLTRLHQRGDQRHLLDADRTAMVDERRRCSHRANATWCRLTRECMSSPAFRSRRRSVHGTAGTPRAARRGPRRCRSAAWSSSGTCRGGRLCCWRDSRASPPPPAA